MSRDPLATPDWFTRPLGSHEKSLIVEIERLEMPWHWKRWDIPAAPAFSASAVTYGQVYADVGYMAGAAPKGCVPVNSRQDIRYAWGLYLVNQRRAQAEAEPQQLTLELAT